MTSLGTALITFLFLEAEGNELFRSVNLSAQALHSLSVCASLSSLERALHASRLNAEINSFFSPVDAFEVKDPAYCLKTICCHFVCDL